MLTKDLAICIRAIDYSETSQIVSFFTRATGKIDAIAKGSKRPKSPFDGPIEVLSHGNIVFVDSAGEKLATLTEFQQQPALINLRNNLFVLYACLFAAELMNNLTHDYDPHPELFDSFLGFLQNANEQHSTSDRQRDILALLILFQLILLREIGLQPILNQCANCKASHESRTTGHELYFSSNANGLICRDCESSFPDKIRLTKKASACLAAFKQIPGSEEKTLKEIEKVLVQHLTGLLGRTPIMAKHILQS
ncbi:MAG: DNA repair protein RecO [Planctomycetes bacterium RBG_19FT_COMBO_48_8]|nr:MAG: DNA repair protein RecO [Planctomycetes bacterium RBG_19FT_COMBO_48_8]